MVKPAKFRAFKPQGVRSFKPASISSPSSDHFSLSPHGKALKELAEKPEKMKGKREHWTQVMLFEHMLREHPEIYKRMAAIPNGVFCHPSVAKSLVAEGLKRGYPDITLDAPRGVYCGLKLELKVDKNQPTDVQNDWLDQLNEDGYYAVCVHELEPAINTILDYWLLPPKGKMPNSKVRLSHE